MKANDGDLVIGPTARHDLRVCCLPHRV